MAGLKQLIPSPFLDIAPRDCVDLDALAAELSDALFNLTADPEPPPGPSDIEEVQALLASVQPLHKAAA